MPQGDPDIIVIITYTLLPHISVAYNMRNNFQKMNICYTPIWCDTGIVSHIVVIHQMVKPLCKWFLFFVCSDWTNTTNSFTEVSINWRSHNWVNSFQLSGCCDIKSLKYTKEKQIMKRWIYQKECKIKMNIEQLTLKQYPSVLWSTEMLMQNKILKLGIV